MEANSKKWSEEERQRLRAAVVQFQTTNWTAIAEHVGRSKNSCRHRWHDHESKLPGGAPAPVGGAPTAAAAAAAAGAASPIAGQKRSPRSARTASRPKSQRRAITKQHSGRKGKKSSPGRGAAQQQNAAVKEKCQALLKLSLLARRIPVESSVDQVKKWFKQVYENRTAAPFLPHRYFCASPSLTVSASPIRTLGQFGQVASVTLLCGPECAEAHA